MPFTEEQGKRFVGNATFGEKASRVNTLFDIVTCGFGFGLCPVLLRVLALLGVLGSSTCRFCSCSCSALESEIMGFGLGGREGSGSGWREVEFEWD